MIDLSNRLEPHLDEIGSICTKTGVNDEERTTGDTIYRQAAIDIVRNRVKRFTTACVLAVTEIEQLQSAQPTYTDEEIQRMQDLESAEIEKAYQLGYEDGKKVAQPQRKTGQLLYHHTENIDEMKTADVYFCSSCKKEVIKKIRFGMFKGELDIQYGYCPHCGADMRGE